MINHPTRLSHYLSLIYLQFSYICINLGAEPSPAYFNIMMYNNREAILDGTQLAADWTFSGLQKFGQGLLDKLRGLKLPHPLLEKVKTLYFIIILDRYSMRKSMINDRQHDFKSS